MPLSLRSFGYERNPDEDPANPNLAIPTQRNRLPLRQVDPYISTVQRLADAGLLTQRFAQTSIAAQVRRQSFINTGNVPRGTLFEEGETHLDEDELRKFRESLTNRIDRGAEVARFIPREHTEEPALVTFLEFFQRFNFAIAGAADALVNLSRGETEESNPFEEFWDGLIARDKETFSDVLENMGWDGKDGVAYWARATTGFVLDVALDPLTYITLGTSAVAARGAGGAATRALRRSTVAFANGSKEKPLEVLNKIATKLSDEAADALRAGANDLPRVGQTASEARASALADLAAYQETVSAMRRPYSKTISDSVKEFGAAERKEIARQAMVTDVHAVFNAITKEQNPQALLRLKEQAGGGAEGFQRWMSLLGAGNKPADQYIAATVFEELLSREGKEFTGENLLRYLTGDVNRLMDQGGLKFMGATIVRSNYLDTLKFNLGQAFREKLGGAAKWFTADERNLVLRGSAKAVASMGEAVGKTLSRSSYAVKKALGGNLRRSAILQNAMVERQQAVQQMLPRAGKMMEDVLTVPGRKANGGALTEVENDVIFDALVAEEDAALEWVQSGRKFFDEERAQKHIEHLRATGKDAEADAIEAAGRLGYETKHIQGILSDPRLAGYTVEQRQQLLEIARKMDETFRAIYDREAAEGLEIAFLDFYVPAQYENLGSVFRAEFKQAKATGQITAEDVFARLRGVRRSRATAPVSQGGFGLKPVRNLYALGVGRIMAAEQARAERIFVSRIMDEFAVHQGQIEKVLGAMYGPDGRIAANILDSIRAKTVERDLYGHQQMLTAFPKLGELKDLVETGKWGEAVEWLEANPDTVNAAMIEGESSLYSFFERSVAEGATYIRGFTESVGENVNFLTEEMREAFGRDISELQKVIQEIVGGAEGYPDLALVGTVSALLEARVRKAMGIEREVRAASQVLEAAATPQWVQASKQAGIDSARAVILDEAVVSAGRRANPGMRKAIEDRFGGKLDKWAKDIAEKVVGGRRSKDVPLSLSLRWKEFDEDFAVLLARILPANAIEQTLDLGGKIAVEDVVSGELFSRIQRWRELRSVDKAAANELIRETWEEIGRNPYIERYAQEYRRRRNLPNVPVGEFSQQQREELLELIAKAKEGPGQTHGIRFFSQHPFYQPTGGEGVAERIGQITKDLDRWVEGDRQLRNVLLNMVREPAGTSRTGLFWQPYVGVKGLMDTGYAARASKFLQSFKDAAVKARPDEVVKLARENKMRFGFLTRSIMDVPQAIQKAQKNLVRDTTRALERAAAKAAERAGVSPSELKGAVTDFSKAIQDSLQRRGYSDVNMTEAHEKIREAFSVFEESFQKVVGDPVGGEMFHEAFSEFGDEILRINQNVSELFRMTDTIRLKVNEIHHSLARTFDFDRETTNEVVAQVEGLADEIRKMAASVEDRLEAMFQEAERVAPDVGLPDYERENFDPLVRSFYALNDDLRADRARMSKSLEAAYRRDRLRLAEAHERTSLAFLEETSRKIDEVLGPMQALQEEARLVERVREIMVRPLPQREKMSGAEYLREWLGRAAADEFVRRGGRTEADWVMAVERVWVTGPIDDDLKVAWEIVKDKEVGPVFDEVRNWTAAGRVSTGSALAHRAARRVTTGTPPPKLDAVQGAAVSALEEHPDVASLLALDEGFLDAVTTRAEAILANEDGTQTNWIVAFADEAFLPADESAEITARIRQEGAWIEAFQEVVQRRRAVFTGLVNRQNPRITQDLQAALLAQRGVSGGLLGFQKEAQAAAGEAMNLVNRYLDDGSLPADADLARLVEEAAENLTSAKEFDAPSIDAFLETFQKRIDDAYAKLGPTLTPEQIKVAKNVQRFGWDPADYGLDPQAYHVWASEAEAQARYARDLAKYEEEVARAEFAPPEFSIVDDLGPKVEDDGYLYHVTTRDRAESILNQGQAVPNQPSTWAGGFYSQHSRGKVFFTDRGGVDFWEGRISEQLDQLDEDYEIAIVRVPKDAVPTLKVDEVGTDDAGYTAWYSERPVSVTNPRPARPRPKPPEKPKQADKLETSETVLDRIRTVMSETDSPILQQLEDLQPAELQSFEQFLRLIGGDITRVPNRRTNYWLNRLGLVPEVRPKYLRLSAKNKETIKSSLETYERRGTARQQAGIRQRTIRDEITKMVESNKELIESRALAQKELELFQNLVLKDLREGADVGFSPQAEELWESARKMRNYLRFQAMRAEHDGLVQLLGNLPSRDELRFLKLRGELKDPAAFDRLPDLTEPRIGGVDAGGTFGERYDLAEQLGAVAWENSNEQWARILDGPGRRLLTRFGLNMEEVEGYSDFLRRLSEAGVTGIEGGKDGVFRIVDQLGFPNASTYELVELNDAVADIGDVLTRNTTDNLMHTPALEGQIRTITNMLKSFSEDIGEQSVALHAITGKSRADQLTSLEAAHVIRNFSEMKTDLLEAGQRALRWKERDLYVGRQAAGHLPRDGYHMDPEVREKAFAGELAERADQGTPEDMVTVYFPRFEGITSPGGTDLGQRAAIPRWAWDAINEQVLNDVVTGGPLKRMLGWTDKASNLWKFMQTVPFPGFHVRNIIDGHFRTFLALGASGLDPRENWRFFRAVRHAKDGKAGKWVSKATGQEYDLDLLHEVFERMGGPSNLDDHLGMVKNEAIESMTDPRLHPFSNNYVFGKLESVKAATTTIAGDVDNLFRFRIFVHGIDQGLPPVEAMRQAQKFLLDYAHGLTPFERQVMRRIFPFYTFSRLSIPLMFETMVKRPGLMGGIAKVRGTLAQDDIYDFDEVVPSYVRQAWQFAPRVENGKLKVFTINGLLAVEELDVLARFAEGDVYDGLFDEIMGRLNPLVKVPIEVYSGKNFYFGSPIRENQQINAAAHLDVPLVRDWLQYREVRLNDGRIVSRVNGERWHYLQQLHFARTYRTLAALADSDSAWGERLTPFLSGVKLTQVDLDRRYQHLTAVSNFHRSKINKAFEQGDFVQAAQVLRDSQREPVDQQRTQDALEALRQITRNPPQ